MVQDPKRFLPELRTTNVTALNIVKWLNVLRLEQKPLWDGFISRRLYFLRGFFMT